MSCSNMRLSRRQSRSRSMSAIGSPDGTSASPYRVRRNRAPRRGGTCSGPLLVVNPRAPETLSRFHPPLRDGAQTNGGDFTLADKLAIAGMLDELGIDYVEGGYPGANPTDTDFFAEQRKLRGKFTPFGM